MELYHLKIYIDDLLHRAVGPVAPIGPVAPSSPLGIVKFKITFSLVPELVTVASVPGSVVVVAPTVIVAAPAGPVGPVGPTIIGAITFFSFF